MRSPPRDSVLFLDVCVHGAMLVFLKEEPAGAPVPWGWDGVLSHAAARGSVKCSVTVWDPFLYLYGTWLSLSTPSCNSCDSGARDRKPLRQLVLSSRLVGDPQRPTVCR